MTSHATTTNRIATMPAFASSTVTTTLWVGEIRVMPVRTRKVTSAESSDITTMNGAK